MEGFSAKRYTTPPPLWAAGPPNQLASSSHVAESATDSLDQRPSPQSRQRSWHHPYMYTARGAQGPSPPMSLEPGAGQSVRPYVVASQDSHAAGFRHRSPPHRLEHAGPESRPRTAPWSEGVSRAQPLNIAAPPPYPHGVERVGGIGPSRNRGRSSTLTLPHPDATRVRGGSFIGYRLNSPSHGPYSGLEEPIPPPRSWEEARFYRDGHPHLAAESFVAHRQSPTLRPPSRPSPILFAPLSPSQDPQLGPPRRHSGQMQTKLVNPGVLARGGQYRSRPGTPISPLNMETLSMEEMPLPSASGMAVPLTQGQQRSPADVRARTDYFGPSAAEWHRSSHLPSDVSGSPPTGSYMTGHRNDPREHAYRASARMQGEAISPDTELPRYPQSAYPPNQTHLHPGRGPGGTMPPHHSGMSRMEQIERERFAMAQHHAPTQGGYFGPGGPQDHGYQSEFAPQGRHGPGSGVVGHPHQHAVPVDRIAHSRRRRRPPYSYSSMITQAIASSSEGRMTLREIYTWISTNFSGYPMAGPDSQGWQNTVRHNLSLGKIFIKKARTAQDIYDSCSSGNPSQSQAARGKGGWWTLHPVVLAQIRSGQRTHNDEFDDVERLVEIENAAAISNPSAAAVPSGSAAMTATSSSASADGAAVPRSSMAELGRHKSLSRQRSYSDSIDPAAVEQRRSGSAQQSSTAPVSRKGSIGASRNPTAGRVSYAPYAVQPDERKGVGYAVGREGMPSVLAPTTELAGSDRAIVYGRSRGHTIAVHETASQHRTNPADADKLDVEASVLTRPLSGSVSGPKPLFQWRTQTVEDVEMEPSLEPNRDSSMVLQEARETLVSAKQQQQQQKLQAHEDDTETQEGAGRMAIRGLLNS